MFNVSLRTHKRTHLFSMFQDFFKNILTVIVGFKILDFCPCDYKSLGVLWLRNMNLFWSKNNYTRLLWLMKGKSQKFIVRVQVIIHNLLFILVSQRIIHMIHRVSLSDSLFITVSLTALLLWAQEKPFFNFRKYR